MKKHLVFDLDGTLSDTQKIHEQIESDFLKEKGVYIEPTHIGKRFAGRTPQEWIAEVLSENDINFTSEELDNFVSGKDEIVIRLLKEGKIELMPGAQETLFSLHSKGHRIGISSGACREFIDEFIVYFGLQKIVIASTSANEVKKKKPHPDVFIASFDKIEKHYGAPNARYVIGDGWSDVEGGHRSGATTIWLNYSDKSKQNETYCNHEIKLLSELLNIL